MFSDAQLKSLRDLSEGFMADIVTIERPSDGTLDGTNVYTPGTTTVVYSGAARISPTSVRDTVVGEERVVLRDATFYIPHDAAEIYVDDLITVITAQDSTLVGRVWRVMDVRAATYYASRKLTAVSIQPSAATSDHIT